MSEKSQKVSKQYKEVIDSYNELANDFFHNTSDTPTKAELLRLLKNNFRLKIENLYMNIYEDALEIAKNS